MKSANERTDDMAPHYQTGEGQKQHWDCAWEKYREAWFVLNVTKYVERYEKKNGVKDLEKAQHYLQKLIELEEQEWREANPGKGRTPAENDPPPTLQVAQLGVKMAMPELLARYVCQLVEQYRSLAWKSTSFLALYQCRIALNHLTELWGSK